ncbi:hypothetical protein [Arthrobacter sp. H5]|uniref:hypothetical protein n=1 Tax=Arthrobacter sp. H5 TaxID=1267973 RepID=UPI000488E406|nr:hypothetical protein [Arthrobacter sp. H5]
MELPTVEELATQLQAVSGAPDVDVDAPLTQLSDVDSMDLMEWLYGFQSQYPELQADASLFQEDGDGGATLRTVHGRLLALAAQPASAK